eukprot:gene2232-2752_t
MTKFSTIISFFIILIFSNNICYSTTLNLQDSPPVFNNQSICLIDNPCDIFDPQIWVGGQVPVAGDKVVFSYNSTVEDTKFYLVSNQVISFSTLVLSGGFKYNINGGGVLNVTDSLVVVNSVLTISVDSTINTINAQRGIISFNSSTSTVNGDVNIDKPSSISVNNTVMIFNGFSNFTGNFYCYLANDLQFNGNSVIFQGLLSNPNVNLRAQNPQFFNLAIKLGSFSYNGTATITNANFYVYNGIQSLSSNTKLILTMAYVTVFGSAPSYISQVFGYKTSNLNIVNSSQVQVDTLQIGDKTSYFSLYIDNSKGVVIGKDNSQYINVITTLNLAGVSDFELHGYNNITSSILSTNTLSGVIQPDSINMVVYNETTVTNGSSYGVQNLTISVYPNAQLNCYGGLLVKNTGAVNVNKGAIFSLQPLYAITALYSFPNGITLQDGSNLYTSTAYIIADVHSNGPNIEIDTYSTQFVGNIYLNGGVLNITTDIASSTKLFQATSIQQISKSYTATINMYIEPVYLMAPTIITTTSASIPSTIINIYLSSQITYYYKTRMVTIWKSTESITGDYITNVLDSVKQDKYTAFNTKVNENSNTITIQYEPDTFPGWKIGVIIVSLLFICSPKNAVTKHIPIGRAGASIIGSTLMVYFNIVPVKEIGSVVNWDTLILLMSMMMLSNYMEKANIWGLASKALLYKCSSPNIFLIRICVISAVMSSILTNDTVCVTITPIVINACISTNLPFFPFLMAIATSANIGSAAMPVGNPQNMLIIGSATGLSFINFFKVSVVSSLLGVAVNTALLYVYFNFIRKDLRASINFNFSQYLDKQLDISNTNSTTISTTNTNTINGHSINKSNSDSQQQLQQQKEEDEKVLYYKGKENQRDEIEDNLIRVDLDGDGDEDYDVDESHRNNNRNRQKRNYEISRYRVSIILLLILAGFFIGLHMGFTVMFGVSILMIFERKDIPELIQSVDWELLLFFGGLFILVDGFDREFAKEAWTILEPFVPLNAQQLNVFKIFIFSVLILVLCNILGNVPLVLSLCPRLLDSNAPNFTWLLLAFVSTVAGNLTLVGSVANLIVAEKSKQYHLIGFFEYLKFGIPSTILVVAIGVPIVVLIGS